MSTTDERRPPFPASPHPSWYTAQKAFFARRVADPGEHPAERAYAAAVLAEYAVQERGALVSELEPLREATTAAWFALGARTDTVGT